MHSSWGVTRLAQSRGPICFAVVDHNLLSADRRKEEGFRVAAGTIPAEVRQGYARPVLDGSGGDDK
jgi:hypothetical protein